MLELRFLAAGCGLTYLLYGLYQLYLSLAFLSNLAMLPAIVGLLLIQHTASILMGLKFLHVAVSDPDDTPSIARSIAKDVLPAYLYTQGIAAILTVCLFPLSPQMIITAGFGAMHILMGLFLSRFAHEHLGNPQDRVPDPELDDFSHGMILP